MDGAFAPIHAAEVLPAASIEIPLHRVTAPQMLVIGAVELLGVERPQGRVERRIVPHIEKLPRPLLELRMEIIHWRAERPTKVAQVAVDFDSCRRSRRKSPHTRLQFICL